MVLNSNTVLLTLIPSIRLQTC